MKITIAGASGFVGRNLIKELIKKYAIKGLSRRARPKSDDNLSWVEADMYSLTSTVKALEDTDIAIYLIHSMMPSTHLFQGNFKDTDILLADNFSRACKKAGVKQIIYLGGLVPEENISEHLESRREVEDVLKSSGIPVTVLRAGMVVGENGSSFEILRNLVFNLPAMILPRWTNSQTQVIFIDDLVRVFAKAINNEDFFHRTIDVVNGDQITYKDLITQTSKFYGKKKLHISVPINYTSFSKLWVKVFGESSHELVSPLIDSLLCNLPSPAVSPLIDDVIKHRDYISMLEQIPRKKAQKKANKTYELEKSVRSIQRLANPYKYTNEVIGTKYFRWLPMQFNHLIRAKLINDKVIFYVLNTHLPLLVLKRIEEVESIDRVKFHIVGGALTQTIDTGWLEFRQVSDGSYTLSSINNFIPSLPWFIYKYTQAPMHAWVMKKFCNYLALNEEELAQFEKKKNLPVNDSNEAV